MAIKWAVGMGRPGRPSSPYSLMARWGRGWPRVCSCEGARCMSSVWEHIREETHQRREPGAVD